VRCAIVVQVSENEAAGKAALCKCQQPLIWDRQLAACHFLSPRLCTRGQNLPIPSSTMAYGGHSNSSFTSSQNPASGSSSLAEAFRCQSKIADLTYRLSSLSNLPSVVSEIIQFVHFDNNYFIHYQTEVNHFFQSSDSRISAHECLITDYHAC
jgi:hypothetical protein